MVLTATGFNVEGLLEREYTKLQPLIELVHPCCRNHLNAMEFVDDVPGEMEREDVNSDEEQLESSSIESVESLLGMTLNIDPVGAEVEDDD